MILVEVGEVVVEENWWTDILGNGELERADILLNNNIGEIADVALGMRPQSVRASGLILKGSSDKTRIQLPEVIRVGGVRRLGNAVCVVDANLLNLKRRKGST